MTITPHPEQQPPEQQPPEPPARGRRRARRFDDASARRRWAALEPDARRAAAAADPVSFVADHLAARERRDGTLVVLLRCDDAADAHRSRGIVCPVAATAPDPTSEDCADLLAPFVLAAAPSEATGIGLVRHRSGPAQVVASDRRWRAALRAAALQAGLTDHGLAVRTADGSLLRP